MPSARPSSSATLVIAIIAVMIGAGLGFVLAPSAPAPTAWASSPTAIDPLGAPSDSSKAARPSIDLNSPDDSRSTAELSTAKTEVSASRFDAAVRDIDLPSTAPNTTGFGGDGAITGRVLDDNGAGLGGITVIASRRDLRSTSGRSTDSVGSGAPSTDTLEQALSKAAERWAVENDSNARVATDANGAFRLTGLTEGIYSVRAYKEGWTFNTSGDSDCFPGDVVNFRGSQVTPLTLDIRLPDGSVATEAIVVCNFGNKTDTSSWSPDSPTLRLIAPRLQIKVYGAMLETRTYEREPMSRYSSEQLTIDAEDLAGTTLEIVLEPRSGIFGTLDMSWEGEDSSKVSISTLENEGDFDPKGPFEDQQTTSVGSGDFLFLDIEDGLYAVGIRDSRSKETELVNYQFVQVDSELVEVDLSVPVPSPSEHIVLYCLDPKGQPVSGVSIRYKTVAGDSDSSGSPLVKKAADGSYWLRRDSFRMPDYDAWPAASSIELIAKTSLYGTQSADLSSGQAEATIQFSNPVSLTVDIVSFAETSYKDQLQVRVVEPNPDDGYPTVIASSQSGRRRGNGPVISKDGQVVFSSLAPGNYEVQLLKSGGWGSENTLESLPITLGVSDTSIQVTPIQLHDLVVYAPGLSERDYLILNPGGLGDNGGDNYNGLSGFGYGGYGGGGSNARLDADNRAVFKDLKPGLYTLMKGWDGEGVEVTVPSGEIVFEPKMPNILRVAITNKEGQLYLAGFRSGDTIRAVNGVEVAKKGLYEGAFEALQQGASDVLIERDGVTQTYSILKISGEAYDAKAMGGMFAPDFD